LPLDGAAFRAGIAYFWHGEINSGLFEDAGSAIVRAGRVEWKSLGEFFKWLFTQVWWVSWPILTLAALYFHVFKNLWDHDAEREAAIERLTATSLHQAYRTGMGRLLDGFDAWLSGPENARGMGPGRVAFSSGLIKGTLLLAAAYPILSIVAQWVAGSALKMGGEELAPMGDRCARGYLLIWASLVVASLVLLHRITEASLREDPNSQKWNLLLFMAAPVFIALGGKYFAPQFDVPQTVAFSFFIGVTVVSGFYFCVSVALAAMVTVDREGKRLSFIVFVLVGTIASWIVLLFTFGGSFTFSFSFAIAFSFASAFDNGAIALYAGLLICVLGAMTVGNLEYDYSESTFPFVPPRPSPLLWIGFLAALALLLASLIETRALIADQQDRIFIAFLGFLPVLNAVADFASVGLTRYLLRKGLGGVTIWTAALDVIGGLLIFFLLGFAAITLFHVIHPRDGVQLIDLPGVFDGLRTNPGDYWWLAVMLGSTLLPTVLHAMAGMFTALMRYPPMLRSGVVTLLSAGSTYPSKGRMGTAGYCGMVMLSIWVPIWGLALLLSMNHGAALRGVIAVFEGFAQMIGAV